MFDRVGQYEGVPAFDAGYKKALKDVKTGASAEAFVPVDKNLEEMLIFAVRYSCGRQSYAPHDVIAFVIPLLPRLSDNMIKILDNEMSDHDKTDAFGGFGDETIDKPAWMRFWGMIKEEKKKRGITS